MMAADELRDDEMTLREFAAQTPEDRKAYFAAVDARLAARRVPTPVQPQPAAVVTARPALRPDLAAIVAASCARPVVTSAALPPVDPNAAGEALAAEIIAAAELAGGSARGISAAPSEAEALAAEIVANARLGERR